MTVAIGTTLPADPGVVLGYGAVAVCLFGSIMTLLVGAPPPFSASGA